MSESDNSWLERFDSASFLEVYRKITKRQKEYLFYFFRGEDDSWIAKKLNVGESTVRQHLLQIRDAFYQKVEVEEFAFKSFKRHHLILLFLKYKPQFFNLENIQMIEKDAVTETRSGNEKLHDVIKDTSANQAGVLRKLAEKLTKGVDLNDKDEEGRTPFFIAVEMKRTEIVDYLLEQDNLDINAKNIYGWTPLHKAVNTGYLPIVNKLIEDERTDYQATTHMKANTVYEAAFSSDEVEIIRMLEEKGVDIELHSLDRFTPLMVAIWRGNYRIADYLIEKVSKSNINARDANGETAFYKAVEKGNFTLVNKLLNKGADYTIGRLIRSPFSYVDNLLLAVERGDINAVKRFIGDFNEPQKIKEAINKSDPPYYRTPLSIASEKGYFELVKLLIENGADVWARNNHGRTPKEMTLRINKHIIEFLDEAEKQQKLQPKE